MRIRNMLFIVIFSLASCNSERPPERSALVRLPSGRQIRIYSIKRNTQIDKSHPSFLMLRYETDLEPKDSKALRDEVQEVWELLKPKADSVGDSYAIIKANEPLRGTITVTRSFSYGFEKKGNGEWKLREP